MAHYYSKSKHFDGQLDKVSTILELRNDSKCKLMLRLKFWKVVFVIICIKRLKSKQSNKEFPKFIIRNFNKGTYKSLYHQHDEEVLQFIEGLKDRVITLTNQIEKL